MSRRRVVVTGMGVVAPCGIGLDAYWQGLLSEPEPGLRRIEGFDPAPYFDNPKEARRSDRFSQFALGAAAMALEQAGELRANPARVGVNIATGVGGLTTLEEQILVNYQKDSRRVSPFLVPMMMSNAASAAVSMKYGFQGPCETTVTACAASSHSIGSAMRYIRWGMVDVMIAGGAESAMTPTALAGFGNMTALTRSGISRPFDAERDGFAMAEAAGVLVLEEYEHAVGRGATIYGEILGAGNNADAYHITAPSPGGAGAVACMELALADAGITKADVRHINAHGTSTPLNDAAEAEAVAKLFDAPGPIVTSTKGVTGHALGAAGAIEAVAVLLSMQHRLIPPTACTSALDPELAPIDLVLGEPRAWEPGISLSNSFGFGGHNGSLVIAPPA
ncbi:MAG: beta-ketoacyl-ACP synthase II [Acidimicrobiales bacterium]|nr:beta-ketoacyl-ACP synthase II [Acidimicrobiales bacterium]